MQKYFSLLSLLGTCLLPGSPLISAQDNPASTIRLVKEPEEHYYLVKKTPVVIICQAKDAAEIFFTCMGTKIPPTSVEIEDVSEIDPGLVQKQIKVTRADVQNYEGDEPFWCTCSAVKDPVDDEQGAVTSRKGYVSIAFLKSKFTSQPAPITATVKENVEIPCGAPEGHPQPSYTWKKDKKRLEVENSPRLTITEEGNLRIQSVTVGDQGLYQCVVRNIAGRHESKGSTLKVLALEESSEPQVAISKGDEVSENETELAKPRATRQTYKTYFTTEPQEKYYITEDKPLLIDCSVVAADILTFRCNGKRIERDRQTTIQGLDAAGNRLIQSQARITYVDVQKFQADPTVSKPYHCICVAWFQDSGSPNGWGRFESKSELGFVHLAYLDETFESEPTDVTAAPDTDVTLVCEPPQGEPHPWVHWYKDGSRLDPRSSNKYIVNARGHLMVHNVQQEDAGAYHCVVENVAKSIQSRVGTLTVIATTLETTTAGQSAEVDFPEFPEVIPSTPIFLRDFQPVYTVDRVGSRTMVCAVISADQITVDCGGKRLAPEEFELKSKTDEGSGKRLLYAKTEVRGESVAQNPDTYFCQCTAWVLNEQQAWEQVISAKGYIKLGAARTVYIGDVFAVAPEDTDAYFEADAKLECKPPEGNPTPKVHWLKDGVPIDPETDPNYVIVEGELILEYVNVSDEGQYTCVAENEAGTRSSKPVQLTVLGKPEPTTGRPEAESKTETPTYPKLEGPFFSVSPDPEYYIIREQPVNLLCTVIAATSLVFVCNGEVVEATRGTDNQTWDSNIKESINDNSLLITKEKVDLHTESTPFTCVCRANYVESDSEGSQNSYVDSSPTVIQVAFLRNHFLQEPSDTKVTSFGTAELVCKAPTGIPEPKVYWLKNGFRISRNERIQVKDSGNLVINSFTNEDEGSYTCVAENLITSRTSRTAIVSISDGEQVDATKIEAQPEPESTTQTIVQRTYFDTPYISKDLQAVYYLVNDKPVTITCEAYDVESITFTCGMQSVEDLNVFARVEQQVRSNGQSEPVKVFEASVNVSKEKVENYESGKEYSCHCFAHYRVSTTGEYKMLNSTKADVKIAYLNQEFETEPEGHTVTEGGFLTIFCKPPQGNPEPRVSWIKDGEIFEAVNIVQNNLLVFTETELEHTGEYICVAENEAGKRQSSPIIVEVKAKSDASMEKGDTDDGDNEFDVDEEPDEEAGTTVTDETGLIINHFADGHLKENDDEETEINFDVLKTEQQQEESSVEISSAKNGSRKSEDGNENQLEQNQMSVVVEETDSGQTDEYETEDILEGNNVNIGGRQKTDAPKCEQMQSQCIDILPDRVPSLDTCLVLPQHISCIDNYISKCRAVVDADVLTDAKLEYEELQANCALQPKCPQLEKCRRVSSTRASNNLTVAQFCKEDKTLSQCINQAVATCGAEMSPEEQKFKSNLYDMDKWLSEFCGILKDNSESLASCDEMMACDLEIAQMAKDNTSWCILRGSLLKCTNNVAQKCQLTNLRSDLKELLSDAEIIFCSEENMEETHSGPSPDSVPEADSKTTLPTTQVTKNDRITDGNDDDDDDDDGEGNSKEVTAFEGGAAGKVNTEDVDPDDTHVYIIDYNEEDADDYEYEGKAKETLVTSKWFDDRYDTYEDSNEKELHQSMEENSRSEKKNRHVVAEKHNKFRKDEDNSGDVYNTLAENDNRKSDEYLREDKDSVVEASKEGGENGSTILCMPVLLATILQLLTVTLYLR